MEITKKIENGETVLSVSGCLDTAATRQFAQAVEAALPGTKTLVLDFSALEFIASSALRLIVTANKQLAASGGGVVIAGMNDVVGDVFDITGLSEVLTVR